MITSFASEIELAPGTELPSSQREVISRYIDRLDLKAFMLLRPQELPMDVFNNA